MTPYRDIVTPAVVAAHGDDPSWVLLDCRFTLTAPEDGAESYAEGHLPGALYADLERDLSGPRDGRSGRHPLPSPEAFGKTLRGFGIGPKTQVVAYDEGSSVYASRLWWLLRAWWGHEAVAVLDGGLTAWLAAGLPLTTDVPPVRPAAPYQRPARPQGVWHETPAIEALVGQAGCPLLVDARGAMRYRGTNESLDPVAGHIPGACNRPFESNLRPDRTFRPAAELREQFLALLDGRSEADIIHYCGSGVSACHNILAMALAGFGVTALYPGSWSAWVSDTRRPVATGDQPH
ncbi:sulfurtransferase [Acidiferrobacter sp.]|uniref:sulfurtransferase n=1 Tax=Acidiferrobacter sp. TaxID=1872107 RepID=UPI0026151630|nr:sulfurtransferase [Acidiferrobacter sp.]